MDLIWFKLDPQAEKSVEEGFLKIQRIFDLNLRSAESDFGLQIPKELFRLSWPPHTVISTSLQNSQKISKNQKLVFKVLCEAQNCDTQFETRVNVCVMLCHGARFNLSESEVVQAESLTASRTETDNQSKAMTMLRLPSVGNYMIKTDAVLVKAGR